MAGKSAATKKSKTTTSKSKNTKHSEQNLENYGIASPAVKNKIAGIVLLAIGAFLIISMQTSAAGIVGETVGDLLKGTFGFGALILPYFLIAYAILVLAGLTANFKIKTIVLLTVLYLMIDLLNAMRFLGEGRYIILNFENVYRTGISLEGGGIFGTYVGTYMIKAIGVYGAYLLVIIIMLISLLLLLNTPLSRLLEARGKKAEEKREKKEYIRQVLEKEEELLKKEREKRWAEEAIEAARAAEVNPKKKSAFIIANPFDKNRPNAPKAVFVTSQQEVEALKEEQLTMGDQLLNNVSKINKPSFLHRKPKKDPISEPVKFEQEPIKGILDRDAKETTADFGLNLEAEKKLQKEALIEREAAAHSVGTGILTAKEAGGVLNATRGDKNLTAKEAGGVLGASALKSVSDFEKEEILDSEKKDEIENSKDTNQPHWMKESIADDKKAEEIKDLTGAAAGTKTSEEEIITKKTELEDLKIDTTKHVQEYKFPPISLLNKGQVKKKVGISESTKDRAIKLEETLNSFGVDAKVINVTEGPSITRYEIQPAVGVKVNSIVRLQDDLALNLRAKTMRIEAPIPGKAAVGIELENGEREMVTLGDIVTTEEFKSHKSKIAFAVGRDIEGNSVVADMKKMPHLLIAGATGAGKSVCINTIISSILYKASPEEVRLVLIDPKMVELGNYNGIPHLLIPVVIDPKKAASALNWAVGEMTERYKKFAETGTKNLETYNNKMKADGELEKVMPQIVIVIDELADLMMVASSVVEDAICRLAQMARAAGMHLIVATQRPSVDVITGLIKANIPSRIAFMVSSQIDSRTIIDMAGAEKLVGNGDMLFKTGDTSKPVRIQCPYISEGEIKNVLDYIIEKNGEESEYEEDVIEKIENGETAGAVAADNGTQTDELLDDAALVVISAGQASVSMLQRRFRIGYNRSARIIDELEALGVIGPSEGSKARQVLLNQMEWDNLKSGGSPVEPEETVEEVEKVENYGMEEYAMEDIESEFEDQRRED